METLDLRKYIEHTILKPDARKEDVQIVLDEAVQYGFLGVCVNPCWVALAKKRLEGTGVKIVTVVGFPLGAMISQAKAFEAETAIMLGADEVDMVLNVGAMKDGDYDYVENDVRAVKKACGENVLKVILETDLLTKEEIKTASELCAKAGADMVKTSTGFVTGGAGAKAEDVSLMAETVAVYGLKVKASAGIRDKEKAVELVEAGAARLGTSSGVKIVT